jgi:ornithine decarboxylase
VSPGEWWGDRAQVMPDSAMAFQKWINRFPGFNYEVQGVFQERIDGRIKFYTYAVRQPR